jgi:hypothetical protein
MQHVAVGSSDFSTQKQHSGKKERHEITHGTISNDFLVFKFLANMELTTRKLNKKSNFLKGEYVQSTPLTDAVNKANFCTNEYVQKNPQCVRRRK